MIWTSIPCRESGNSPCQFTLQKLGYTPANLRSGVPIFFIRGGKVRLIQLLDYLSVASPESGLFPDWSRNKRYLEQNNISVSLACY